MNRDPFYNKIIGGLTRQSLDPDLFEKCARDLLRADFPGLASVPGGQDAGMDGSIPDGEASPYPLIVTTSQDVIGNLTKNLNAYLKEGDGRKKAVLATSRDLTPRRVRNCFKRAKELGFVLVQLFQREDIAVRLYKNPKWCKELLNLTGSPPALSIFPRTIRPGRDVPLIGRTASYEWLGNTRGDRLVYGQPGSGKTFLLQKLVDARKALFVVSDDMVGIAEAFRESDARCLILDDAQLDESLIQKLLHLRQVSGSSFEIVASCWPNQKNRVAALIGIPSSKVHELDLLSRDEIAEVIRDYGIKGPDVLLHELINQAEGKPGLAVTLAEICLQGDVERAYYGDALANWVLEKVKPLVGHEAGHTLACFALGGNGGMKQADVARHLSIPEVNVRRTVTELAAAGVIVEVGDRRLAVRPPALREVLVKETYGLSATSLEPEDLIRSAPDPDSCLLTLICSALRGAIFPATLLDSLVGASTSHDCWQAYAQLGKREAENVIKRRPEQVVRYARVLLDQVPNLIIPHLLEKAIGDARELHSHPNHPLRILEDWVKSVRRGRSLAVKRRQMLLENIEKWMPREHDAVLAGLLALPAVMNPCYEISGPVPGSGRQFSIGHGVLSAEELLDLKGLWPRVVALIRKYDGEDFNFARNLVLKWEDVYRATEEEESVMVEVRRAMIRDLAPVVRNMPALAQWIRTHARSLDISVDLPIYSDFDTIFPPYDYSRDWKEVAAEQSKAVEELAREKVALPDGELVAEVKNLSEHASVVTFRNHSDLRSHFWEFILEKRENPSALMDEVLRVYPKHELISPTLFFLKRKGNADWMKFARTCLEIPEGKSSAAAILLSSDGISEDLLDLVMSSDLADLGNLIEALFVREEVPGKIALRLLGHSVPAVYSAAASGIWRGGDSGEIKPSLLRAWEDAIIRVEDSRMHHLIPRVFAGRPELAFRWCLRAIREEYSIIFQEDVCREIFKNMTLLQRSDLLANATTKFSRVEFFEALIGFDLTLFRQLLSISHLKRNHLAPLCRTPNDSSWREMAILALDSGYSTAEIGRAIFSDSFSWTGNLSAYWQNWVKAIEPLVSDSDSRIREIGSFALEYAKSQRDQELKTEKHEDIFGRQFC